MPGSGLPAKFAEALTLKAFHRVLIMFVLVVFVIVLCQPLKVAAQIPTSVATKAANGSDAAATVQPPSPVSADSLKKRLEEAQAQLTAIEAAGQQASGAPPDTPAQQLQLRVRLLRQMTFSYRQHLSALDGLAEQRKLAADAEAKRRAWTGLAEKPPHSILLADRMRTELQANLLNLRSEEGRLKILAAQIENTRENLVKAGERNRLAQEVLEAANPSDQGSARWRRDLSTLEVRALGAYLEALAAQSQLIEGNIAEFGRVVDFDRRKIVEAEKSVVFRPEDLERLKFDLDERRSNTIAELDRASQQRERISGELDKAISSTAAAQKQITELRGRLAQARRAVLAAEAEVEKAENPEGLLQKANPFRGRAAKAELDQHQDDSRRIEKELAAAQAALKLREQAQLLAVEHSRNAIHEVDALNVGLITLDMQRTFWDLRYAAFEGEAAGTLDRRKNYADSRRLLNVLNPSIDHVRAKLEILAGQIAEQQNLLRVAGDSAETALRKAMVELLKERERLYLVAFAEVEATRHLLLRWVEDEDVRAKDRDASERVSNWFDLTDDWLKAAWTFELFSVEDSIVVDGRTITGSRGVTIAKVVKAILIVVVGYILIALLTRLLVGLAVRRERMEETSARIARKWILAVTLVVLLLLALDVVKIPLTVFAFLGGAIAIGAGFGMQTLLKNLISGVMLLMERPFKPRDIVEVGGIRGEVTDINVRSCTIRDVNGIETLVPNSTFLEQNVTNWTLSNRKVRYTLNISVAYGSSVRQVSDLLLEVAARHKQVLNEPAPDVLFMDFGESALQFALFVWLEVGAGRRGGSIVLSDLRFMIDASFAEEGIVMPFPQRKVHLDVDSPLPVRVISDSASGVSPASQSAGS
ncbi:MAG: mechanosensitive ion channel [Azoarcus sp.]|nr:mechanosensitive ion channel [Azoarcus sp.]